MISGVTAEEVRDQDAKWRAKGYLPADVAGYVAPAAEGRRVDYAALWVTPGPEVEYARLYVGVADGAALDAALAPYLKEGYLPRTLAPCELDGQRWNSGVWYKPRSPIDGDGRVYGFGRGQWWYESKLTPSRFQLDVRLAPVGRQQAEREILALFGGSPTAGAPWLALELGGQLLSLQAPIGNTRRRGMNRRIPSPRSCTG